MRAQPKANADWAKARARRAAAGKAPRLALVRMIVLRGHDADRWSVAIWTKRYGVWQRPERLCSRVSLKRAEATILSAWRSCRLPLAQHGADDRHLRPFYLPDAYHALGRR